MKKIKHRKGSARAMEGIPSVTSVTEYVANRLEWSDRVGAVERAEDTAVKTAEALGRLLQYMADNCQIDCANITNIVYGSRDMSAEFTTEELT